MSGISLANSRIADKWLVLVAVTIGMFMSLMDSTIVNVAIPQMQATFGADIHAIQWVVTIYMLTQAAVIPTAPYLAKKYGGKRAYVWTLTAFLIGSLLCGFAWNLPSLILFRFVQGIGGGILLPLVMTLLYQAFPPEERGTAVSAMGIPLMVAPMAGPVVGGYLVNGFGWPWAFFINVPLGIIAVVIAQKALRQSRGEQQTRFDGAGFVTAAAGSALLLYGASAVTSDGGLLNALYLIAGILLVVSFVVIELVKRKHGRQPLLDLHRFRDRTFSFSVLANMFAGFVRFGIIFLVPIYLQTLRQLTALEAGSIMGAQALATLASLPISGRLANRVGSRLVVIVGLGLFAGAMALMTTLNLQTPIWIFTGILVLLGCAAAFTQQIPVTAMSNIAKEDHQEVANGSTLVTVLHATAAPLGVATLSSFVEARSQQYTTRLAEQGLTGTLLQHQSLLLGMREGFVVASVIVLIALVSICCVPKRSRQTDVPHESVAMIEA